MKSANDLLNKENTKIEWLSQKIKNYQMKSTIKRI